MMTEQQRMAVINYVRHRIGDGRIPAYRSEYIKLTNPDGSTVKVALPSGEFVGEVTLHDKRIGIRTDAVGRLVYGHRVGKGMRRKPLPPEMVAQFIDAFGELLRRVEE
jgi:hypothetical protein